MLIIEAKHDVFVGGELDGLRVPQDPEHKTVGVAFDGDIYDRETVQLEGADVSFWVARDISMVEAMNRLLLHYKPPPQT